MSSPRFWYGLALGLGVAWWLGRRQPRPGVGGAGSARGAITGKHQAWSGLGRFQ